MNDVSKTNELIAEARKFLFIDSRYGYEDTVGGDLIYRLADALEAAARVPVQGEPNARVVTRSLDSDCALGVCMRGCSHLMWLCDACSSEGGWGATRDKLKKWAAEHVCPQPPAVQGEPNDDREALAKVMDTLAYYHCRSVNPKADHPRTGYHSMTEDQREHLREKQREAAEEIMRTLPSLSRATVPDTATAAVERIREAVSGHPECDRYSEDDVISCGWKSAYASVVAALDGAPEPEVKP